MATVLDEIIRLTAARPAAMALGRLDADGLPGATLSRGELLECARGGATQLFVLIRPGDRVVLAYAPGIDFVVAVLAVWMAGGVVVTASPPTTDRTREWLLGIVRESEAALMLTNASLVPSLTPFGQLVGVPVASLAPSSAAEEAGLRRGPSDLALLQFTSGSTSAPRGVRITHENLLANLGQMMAASRFNAEDVCVTWLPHYHNMGLMGVILLPLWAGFPTHLMSPMEFLERPGRWLRAISEVRATFSGGPNFAFDLAAIRTSGAEAEGLDLSCWQAAFCGSEPVRPATLARFSKRFTPFGFDVGAFYPSYGMAEATLLVTGGAKHGGAKSFFLDAEALADGRALEVPADSPRARALVGLGRCWGDLELAIIDPDQGLRQPEGVVGEVWLRGPSVSDGYWRPVDSNPFGHALSAETGWLRTGDLGLLLHGELILTGRMKELIIVNGRNLYPSDLEQALEGLRPRVQAAVAFAVEAQRGERLVVIAEVDAALEMEAQNHLQEEIRLALRQEDVTPHAVVLVPPGGIVRTATGKMARFATRDAYVAGALPSLIAAASV
ncbi:MAG: fatty acyl-AMP ligase [Candidatus Sericytochromatia bacterium]|nr:fatty acyl-AMP ligase [Candidatus Sericytochromatia bacterium]